MHSGLIRPEKQPGTFLIVLASVWILVGLPNIVTALQITSPVSMICVVGKHSWPQFICEWIAFALQLTLCTLSSLSTSRGVLFDKCRSDCPAVYPKLRSSLNVHPVFEAWVTPSAAFSDILSCASGFQLLRTSIFCSLSNKVQDSIVAFGRCYRLAVSSVNTVYC